MLRHLLAVVLTISLVPTLAAGGEPTEKRLDTEAVLGPLAEVPCQPEAMAGGVRCLVDGQSVFEVAHPSLYPDPQSFRSRTDGDVPVGPVEVGGDYYYGIENELYRFDADRRTVRDRVRFPAPIVEIEDSDQKLEVTVEAPPHRTGPVRTEESEVETVTIDYEPGQTDVPGRGPWNWTGTLGPLHDAMWLEGVALAAEPGEAGGEVETTPKQNRRALWSLEHRRQFDETNPYIPVYRGEALDRLGRSEAAREAFQKAVEHPGADWIDGLRIGLRLEIRGYSELSAEAFDRARDQMETAGVRGEYVTAMMNATFAFAWLPQALGGAVSDRDVETAVRVAEEIDTTFPNLEGAPAAWGRLAAFFDEVGDDDRAADWRARADEIRGEDVRPDRFFEEAAESVDLFVMLQIGLLLTAMLSGAILGLRRYEEDDEADDEDREKDGDDRPEWMEYLPRFHPVDLVMLGGVFVVLVASPMMVAPQVQSMTTIAEAPPAASGDAVAAPAVEKWAGGLTESLARNELIDESRTELEATKEGAKGPGEADVNALIVEAIREDTRSREIWRLSDVETSEQAMQEFEWLRPLVELEFDTEGLVLLIVVLGMNALIFGGLLQAVARRFEPVYRFGRTFVPGAPNSLRVLRLPVLASFFVGLALMLPFGRAIQASTEASLVALYGLEEAPVGLETSGPAIGFGLVLVALVVHAVGVVRDRRADQ